ncbi:MAG: hypothetical protein U0736_14240 [Gemmataceae bacterium]
MEIQTLRLVVTDADVASLATELIPDQDGLDRLRFRFTPDGVILSGAYSTGFGITVEFETLWEVRPAGPSVRFHLADIKVGGFPAKLLRGVLLRMIRDVIEGHQGLAMDGETLVVHVPTVAARNGVPIDIHLTGIQMGLTVMIVEAGAPS